MPRARNPRNKVVIQESSELRQHAEERLGEPLVDSMLPGAEGAEALVHELRVHQIELEMQNEELRGAQLELDAQREKYFELFDLAPVGYLTLDDDGRVVDANLTAANLMVLERQALVGQPFSAFVLASDRDVYYLYQRKTRESGEPQTCELRLRRIGGSSGDDGAPSHFWARLDWRLQGAPDGVSSFSWVTVTDIGDRRLAEDELAHINASSLKKSRRGESLTEALNEVNAKLNASFEQAPVMGGVLETACSALGCDVALLGRVMPDDACVEYAFGTGLQKSDLKFELSLLDAMSSGAPVVVVSAGSPYEAWLSTELGLAEAIIVPVPSPREVGSALLFGRAAGSRRFDDQETDFVRRFALSLALSLANAAQFESERHIAETLQQALLLMPPSIRGLEFGHLYRSATSTMLVGGDFFDVFQVIGGRVGVLLGDVSGKGLQAAVHISIIKDTIKAYAYTTSSPREAMARANTALVEAANLPDFASVFYAVIDGAHNSVTYCNAGHPPAAVIAADGSLRLLEGTAPVIGAFARAMFEDITAPLGPTDKVLLYTDGVTEARDPAGGFFAEEGLLSLLESADGKDVAELPSYVMDAVMKFSEGRLRDDIALLAFRHTGDPAIVR